MPEQPPNGHLLRNYHKIIGLLHEGSKISRIDLKMPRWMPIAIKISNLTKRDNIEMVGSNKL